MDKFNTSLLDKSIDDIEDLAGFAVPPNGTYILKFNAALKEVNNKDAVEASFEVVEVTELNDPSTEGDPATKPGTKFSTLFFIDNEIALSKLKELVAPIAEHTGQRNMLILLTQEIKDLVIGAKVSRRADKNDKDKVYATVSNIVVA